MSPKAGHGSLQERILALLRRRYPGTATLAAMTKYTGEKPSSVASALVVMVRTHRVQKFSGSDGATYCLGVRERGNNQDAKGNEA